MAAFHLNHLTLNDYDLILQINHRQMICDFDLNLKKKTLIIVPNTGSEWSQALN